MMSTFQIFVCFASLLLHLFTCDYTSFDSGTHELFATIKAGSCGTGLTMSDTSFTISSARYYTDFDSVMFLDKMGIYHRKIQQKLFTYSLVSSKLTRSGSAKYQIEWFFDSNKTLSERFSDSVEYGENVTWKTYYNSELQSVVNGTWYFASGSGITLNGLKYGSDGDTFTDNYALWGAPEYETSTLLDASSTSLSIATIGYSGVLMHAGSTSSQTSQCSSTYRTGSSLFTSSSSLKFITALYVENLANITDCEVSDWSDYSSCSGSCGIGTSTKTREILTNPSVGGNACPTTFSVTKECDTEISCAPRAVQLLNCSSFGSGSAFLNWTEPLLYDDSYPITGYTVRGRLSGDSWKYFISDTASVETDTSLSGLQPSSEYEFSVAGINSEGTGDFSSLCNVATDDSPTVKFADNGLSIQINYGVDITDFGFDLSVDCDVSALIAGYELWGFSSDPSQVTCNYLSSKLVAIYLYSGSSLLPGSNISVITDFLYEEAESLTTNLTISEGDWIVTNIIASYASINSHCSPWSLDLRRTVGVGGNVLIPTVEVSVADFISFENSSFSIGDVIGTEYYTSFSPYYFSPLVQITLNVTVTTFVGTVKSLLFSVNFTETEAISLSFSCSNQLNMFAYESHAVTVYPSFSQCYGENYNESNDDNATYEWNLSENNAAFVNIEDFGLYTLLNGKRLIIPRFSFEIASQYELKVVRSNSMMNSIETESSFSISVGSTYPVAVIRGGSFRRSSRFDTEFKIDGSLSYEPSSCYAISSSCYDDLIYYWSCYYYSDGDSCGQVFTTTETIGNLTRFVNQPDVIYLNLSDIWRGQEENIVLELTLKSNLSSLETLVDQYVYMTNDPVEELLSASLTLPDVVNSNDMLYFGGTSSGSESLVRRYVVKGLEDAYIDPQYSFLNSSFAILISNVLTNAEEYIVTYYCDSDFAQSLIFVNEPPQGGNLSFSNSAMFSTHLFVAFNDSLTILAEGWVDYDLPVLYAFSILVNNSEVTAWVPINLDLSSSISSSIYLPPGDWDIAVSACDSYGACSEAIDSVSMSTPAGWQSSLGYDTVFSTTKLSSEIFLASSTMQYITDSVLKNEEDTSMVNTTISVLSAYHLLNILLEQFGSEDKHEILHHSYQALTAFDHIANSFPFMSQADKIIVRDKVLLDYIPMIEEAIYDINTGDYDQETCSLFLSVLDELDIIVGEKYLVEYFEHIFKTECGKGVFVWEDTDPAIIVSSSKSTLFRFALLNVSSSLSMSVDYGDYPSSAAGAHPSVFITVPDSLLQSSSEFDYLDMAVTDLATSAGENSTIAFAANWFSLIAFDSSLPDDFIQCNKWVGAKNGSCSMEVTSRESSNLTSPIIILIPLKWKTGKIKTKSLSCVWLNETSGMAETSGCSLVEVDADEGYATCECDKIAAFSVGSISLKQSDCELSVEEESELSLVYESLWYVGLKYFFMIGYFFISIVNCVSFYCHYVAEKRFSITTCIFFLFIPISAIRLAYFITLFSLDTSTACLENLSVVTAENSTYLLVAFLHDLSPPLNLLGYSGIFVFWLNMHQKLRYNKSGISKIEKKFSMVAIAPFVFNIAYCLVYYGSLVVVGCALGGGAIIALATRAIEMFSLALFSSVSVTEACILLMVGRKLIESMGNNDKMVTFWKYLRFGSLHYYLLAGILIVIAIKSKDPESPPTLSPLHHVLLFSFGYNVVEMSLNIVLALALFNKRKNSPNSMNETLSDATKKGSIEMVAQWKAVQEGREQQQVAKKARKKRRRARRLKKQRFKRNLFDDVEENLECEATEADVVKPLDFNDEEEFDLEGGSDEETETKVFNRKFYEEDDDDAFDISKIHTEKESLQEDNPMRKKR